MVKTRSSVAISPFVAVSGETSGAEPSGAEENPLITTNPRSLNVHENCKSSGAISRYYNIWQKISNNNFLLRIIKEGYRIQFLSKPSQSTPIISNPKSLEKRSIFKAQIENYIAIGAISEVPFMKEQYVSRIFTVKKSNGEDRLIIDLSNLNLFVSKVTFKMDNLSTIKNLLFPNDFMTSIDLSDAFFSVPLHADSKLFVTFQFDGKRYSFNVLPFGLSSSPRIFSKVLRPVIIWLRTNEIKITSYMDDILICSDSYEKLVSQTSLALKTLESVGFKINYNKSQLIPRKEMAHLGYIWNTFKFTISLPADKVEKTRNFALKTLRKTNVTFREASSFLGLVVSHINAFKFAPLHYREFQLQFINKFKSNMTWDDEFKMSNKAISDLEWWSKFSSPEPLPIREASYDIIMFTDASLHGWGCSLSSGEAASGQWSEQESRLYILTFLN